MGKMQVHLFSAPSYHKVAKLSVRIRSNKFIESVFFAVKNNDFCGAQQNQVEKVERFRVGVGGQAGEMSRGRGRCTIYEIRIV